MRNEEKRKLFMDYVFHKNGTVEERLNEEGLLGVAEILASLARKYVNNEISYILKEKERR
jgi:hypothetical protein